MNDIIVSVNGVSTVNVSHEVSVGALKKAGRVVTLVRFRAVFRFARKSQFMYFPSLETVSHPPRFLKLSIH